MNNSHSVSATCPAIFFCAPASGQGKTTITAGIARHHRNQGLDVRVFKTGPDYLDPLILEQASSNPVTQLDMWMVGKQACKQFLYEAALEADLILIEGVMGMFDGSPSGADMAQYFGIPVIAIIDARAMAQTFAAIAYGLANYRPDSSYEGVDLTSLEFVGVIANKVGSDRHADLITEAMPADVNLLACLKRDDGMQLPERHLGLVFPSEVSDIDQRLDAIADIIASTQLIQLPKVVEFYPATDCEADLQGYYSGTQEIRADQSNTLQGIKIGIARDAAFSFIYAANIQFLSKMGAELIYFSPLSDSQLPDVDALWFPGGYPELHLAQLQANKAIKRSIQTFYAAGKKILAECGGMLYLQNTLTSLDGECFQMVGLIPGDGYMRERGGCQGMQYAPLLGNDNPAGEVRAHAHHRSRSENTLEPIANGRRTRHPAPGEPIMKSRELLATYLHLYFPSNPNVILGLFK